MIDARNKRILLLGCMHVPYEHPDTLAFLTAIKEKYKPSRIIHLGDEVDNHSVSYHESNPDLDSAGVELSKVKKRLQPYFKLFPRMDIMDSNHGSLVHRKMFSAGLPKEYLRSLGEVYGAPKGWAWSQDLTIQLPDGNKLYCCHQMNNDVLKAVMLRGVCIAQAHHHSTADVRFVSNPDHLLWGITVGCLIDRKAMAFAYNKIQLKRPIISVGLVLDGVPMILYMKLDKSGRWTKKL